MRTGRLLGAGRTADVYEIHDDERESGRTGRDGPGGTGGLGGSDGAWVLRRYRDGWGDAAAEAEVMEYVRGHGYPVPRVRSATRTEMVLERLSGPTMVEAFAAGLLDPAQAGAILARLLHDLHALPPRLPRDLHALPPRNHAVSQPGGSGPATPTALPRVLHLDLHPENVIVTPHGPQVIDWNNAEEGPPGLDWGVSAMILAQVVVDTADSRADMAHATLASLLAHQPDGPSALTDEGLVEAARRRAANPTMTAREVELIGDAEELIRCLAGSRMT